MKALILFLSLLALAPVAQASERPLVSRSAGKLHGDQSVDLSKKLQQQDLIVRTPADEAENYVLQPQPTALRSIAAHPAQYFEIYNAEVYRSSDFDGDGYFHRIGVIFDVDVYNGDADIYAKIYLSREAGPWTQVFTTDLFGIVEDSEADTYEVATELLEGYEPGYYSLLLEIYSLHDPHMVASAILDFDDMGEALRLEDQGWDDPYPYAYSETYTEVTYSHGGGALPLLPMLLGLFAIAARGRKNRCSPLSDD